MHKCLVFRPQGRREKKKKKHVKHTRNAEMSFNSEPKVHIIYHYLEGDWEKAISKYFLAGAVFNSMSGEPEGLLSYISSCFSKSKAQKALHRLLPPEMSSHYLATRGDGIRAQEVPASWGQGSSPLPKRITKNQQTDIPRGGVLGGGEVGGEIHSCYFPREAWHPGCTQSTPGAWARRGGKGPPG